uniref:Hexosyltransferase n=1 Tax=Cacopsylla melanoneura TaxID=428564 RepID=A0A8D8LU88_9HEMI
MSIHLRKIAMKKPRSKYLFGISLVFGTLLYFHLFQPHLLYGYADMTEVKGWEMNRSRNSSLYVRPLVQTHEVLPNRTPVLPFVQKCENLGRSNVGRFQYFL